ncbi:unnamed protein product, partial [Nesidiocoris tenuis]
RTRQRVSRSSVQIVSSMYGGHLNSFCSLQALARKSFLSLLVLRPEKWPDPIFSTSLQVVAKPEEIRSNFENPFGVRS